MEDLKNKDPGILAEFEKGNWVVNKNEDTPFYAIGNYFLYI